MVRNKKSKNKPVEKVTKLTPTNNNQKEKEPLTSPEDCRHGIINEVGKSTKRMVPKVKKNNL